jgi:hypothetical protein
LVLLARADFTSRGIIGGVLVKWYEQFAVIGVLIAVEQVQQFVTSIFVVIANC